MGIDASAGPEGDTEGGDLTEREGRALDRLVERIQDSAVAIWLLGGSMTAMGRIFADVHWYAPRILLMHADSLPPSFSLAKPLLTCYIGTLLQ